MKQKDSIGNRVSEKTFVCDCCKKEFSATIINGIEYAIHENHFRMVFA